MCEREREYLVDISPIFDCLLLNWVKHGGKMETLKVCAKVFQRIKTKRTQRKKDPILILNSCDQQIRAQNT